jgi:hypothetical protein
MLELDLLGLRQTECATYVSEWFLGKHDCARSNGSDLSDELHVLDSLCEKLQATAVLFEKPQTRSINLTINQ